MNRMRYINEDGCTPGTTGTAPVGATPGNTMGMGNPMAPTDGENGSGDVPTAKIKRKRKSIKDYIKEGLFDIDVDIESSKMDNVVKDEIIKTFDRILGDERVSVEEYNRAYNALREYCSKYGEEWSRDARSLFRQKDKTVVVFMKDQPKKSEYQAIEIRRFIRNPLPYVLSFWIIRSSQSAGQNPYSTSAPSIHNNSGYVVWRIGRLNHPQTPTDFKQREEFYVMNEDFWTDLDIPSQYRR